MRFFAELGSSIEQKWAATHHDLAAFPAIATEALTRSACHQRVDFDSILDWLATTEGLPPQNLGSAFGEPPIHVYDAGRWVIQLLFWTEGRTSIHAHDFCGAFAVLHGSSIQRRFTFQPHGYESRSVQVGTVALQDCALLPQGSVEPILPGSALIHSVFHLDCPTISVVVRSAGGHSEGPQFDYWAPALATDPEYADPLVLRRTQMLALLLRSQSEKALPFAEKLLDTDDLNQVWRVLDLVLGVPSLSDGFKGLVHRAEARLGAVITPVVASLRTTRWEQGVLDHRRTRTDPDERFLLAALMSSTNREQVFRWMTARSPGRAPLPHVRELITRLVGPASNPADEAMNTACIETASQLMSGRTLPEVIAWLGNLRAPGQPEPWRSDPTAFCTLLLEGTLRPLFR